jgi:DNA-binding response OmpR family regulator
MKTRVLMVEDDTATGEVLAEVLRDAGYDVTLVDGGREALTLLEQQTFAVVVSDMRMPAVDGLTVLQAARQTHYQPEVILLTGYGTLDTSLEALREGAFDYILKPCKPDVLLKRVADAAETHTRRHRQSNAVQQIVEVFDNISAVTTEQTSPAASPPTATQPQEHMIEVGALRIGSSHHSATFGGHELHLTPMEHSLLHCLAQASGRVVSYQELVYCMYGHEVTNTEAQVLLKTHVRNVRRKIDPAYLVNIRSTGYKLTPPES